MNSSVQLSVSECRDLLEGGVVGRVAMATPVGPRIVPVNYSVHGDAIVFRTAPYSELSTYGWNADLAFERSFRRRCVGRIGQLRREQTR